MAFTGKSSDLITGEQMGVFGGYIRRPLPNQAGMIAQIFGENGDDADTILALSLSKYQDVQVFVNIYLIKDPNGMIMKKGDEYPLISSFLGFVKRSLPKKDGMIAQFFSPNGEHADSVSLLSKSEYQDSLVFVDVRGSLASQNPEQVSKENLMEIESHYAEKVTKYQKLEIARHQKQFKKMNEHILLSEFLYKIEVLTELGLPEEYKRWLPSHKSCAHAKDRECNNATQAVEINSLFKPFNFLPCCEKHKADLQNEEHIQENLPYYEMKHKFIIKDWGWNRMKELFSPDGKSEPDPSKVIEWATAQNVRKYLPTKYNNVIS